jgi:hypothetical protein
LNFPPENRQARRTPSAEKPVDFHTYKLITPALVVSIIVIIHELTRGENIDMNRAGAAINMH